MASGTHSTTDFSTCERVKGVYKSPWKDFHLLNLGQLFKIGFDYTFSSSKESKPTNATELDANLPVQNLDVEKINKKIDDTIQVTWIGHATLLVQMQGLAILTDPIFSQRCSPVSFTGPKRYRPVPSKNGRVPKNATEAVELLGLTSLDVVIISHNHYDHLDKDTVKALASRYPHIQWLVPAGVDEWLHNTIAVDRMQIKGCEWWKSETICGVDFTFLPAKHWSGRGALDRFQTLWGSWCIGNKKTSRFYFAGDTGYCEELFKEIGKKFNGFDCAAIPIGAYKPRAMMECQHVDPEQAVQIHKDLKSKQSIGMHWGTFGLAYEHYMEPKKLLAEELIRQELRDDEFITLQHGQTFCLQTKKEPAAGFEMAMGDTAATQTQKAPLIGVHAPGNEFVVVDENVKETNVDTTFEAKEIPFGDTVNMMSGDTHGSNQKPLTHDAMDSSLQAGPIQHPEEPGDFSLLDIPGSECMQNKNTTALPVLNLTENEPTCNTVPSLQAAPIQHPEETGDFSLLDIPGSEYMQNKNTTALPELNLTEIEPTCNTIP